VEDGEALFPSCERLAHAELMGSGSLTKVIQSITNQPASAFSFETSGAEAHQ
jgi:hypothetical protein